MLTYLTQLTLPGYGEIQAPPGVPRGGNGTLSTALGVGIQIFLIVVIIASLLYLMWGGINWIRSEGDPTKIESARKQIIYSIIGLSVALLSFGLVAFLGSFLGVDLL